MTLVNNDKTELAKKLTEIKEKIEAGSLEISKLETNKAKNPKVLKKLVNDIKADIVIN